MEQMKSFKTHDKSVCWKIILVAKQLIRGFRKVYVFRIKAAGEFIIDLFQFFSYQVRGFLKNFAGDKKG